MKRLASSLALAVTLLAGSSAMAATTTYRATMSGPSEAPPNASPGASLATVIIDNVAMTMSLTMPFIDLLDETTMAHLHCCTAEPLIGTAPVAVPFNDFPLGVREGLYSRSFNLSDPGTYNAAFITAHGGTVDAARTFLLNGIGANESYLNIHTGQFPAGEIRGFLVALPVPEPDSWLMLGAGLAAIGLYTGRKNGYGR